MCIGHVGKGLSVLTVVHACPNLCGNLYVHLHGMVVSGWVHVAAYSCCSSRGQRCFTLLCVGTAGDSFWVTGGVSGGHGSDAC